MKKFLPAIFVIATLGAGCGSTQPATPTTTTDNSQSQAVATAPAQTPAPAPAPSAALVDACVAVTPALIKQQLGLDVTAGVSKDSNLQGSTCTFKSADGQSTTVIVQFTAKGEMYYQPESWFKNGVQLGVGDKGIFMGPDSGNTTAELMKNGSLAYVTIFSKGTYTAVQVKGFMKAIADQF